MLHPAIPSCALSEASQPSTQLLNLDRMLHGRLVESVDTMLPFHSRQKRHKTFVHRSVHKTPIRRGVQVATQHSNFSV